MNPVSFLFGQLKNLSLDTELLEASDWSDEIAQKSFKDLQDAILKYEKENLSVDELELSVKKDLEDTNPKHRVDVLIKILRIVIQSELKNIAEEPN